MMPLETIELLTSRYVVPEHHFAPLQKVSNFQFKLFPSFSFHFFYNALCILYKKWVKPQYICKAQTKSRLELVYSSESRIPRDLISRFYIRAQISKTTKSSLTKVRKQYIFRCSNISSHGKFLVFYYNILYWFYANEEKVCKGDWIIISAIGKQNLKQKENNENKEELQKS